MKLPTLVILLVILTAIPGKCEDWYTIWDSAGATWYQKWNKVLNTIDTIPNGLKMELLGKATALGSDTRMMSDEKREIFTRAQTMMLALPGHAEYYRDRINTAREQMEEALKSGNDANYATIRHALADEVMYGFETLKQLPSVETVRVLGEFLSDERGYKKVTLDNPTEKERYESIKHSPVFHKAAGALDSLPIVAKPMAPPKEGYDCPEDTSPWRQWYQEIKDGKCTFRFEGDPTEYDLNGPAPKEKLARITRDDKRETERLAGHRKNGGPAETVSAEAPQRPKPASIAAFVAAFLLLAGAVVYCVRHRRRSA